MKFYFIDAESSALLDSVSFTLTGGDFSDSGVYDYFVTYNDSQLTKGVEYRYTADRSGYFTENGSFTFEGGQVIKIFFKPKTLPVSDEVNHTSISFMVYDAETNRTVEDAQIIVKSGGKSYFAKTNENGYAWVEVPKNSTYEFVVSAKGYYSIKDSVWVGKDSVHVDVYLPPKEGGRNGGSGESGESEVGGNLTIPQIQEQAEQQILAALWKWGTMIVWFALMITFLNLFGMIKLPSFRRRRR